MNVNKFKDLLDDQNDWPEYYTFKFVIKTELKAQLVDALSDQKVTEKLSKNGKYTSVTSRLYANNADDIIEVYAKVKKIDGVLAL